MVFREKTTAKSAVLRNLSVLISFALVALWYELLFSALSFDDRKLMFFLLFEGLALPNVVFAEGRLAAAIFVHTGVFIFLLSLFLSVFSLPSFEILKLVSFAVAPVFVVFCVHNRLSRYLVRARLEF
jgi:hypothetical protein